MDMPKNSSVYDEQEQNLKARLGIVFNVFREHDTLGILVLPYLNGFEYRR